MELTIEISILFGKIGFTGRPW